MLRRLVAVDRIAPATVFEPLVRERVVERFATAAAYPVVTVIAPAGFGKSVAIRQYLTSANGAFVRYDVRRGGATLASFVNGLASALGPPAIGTSVGETSGIVERALRHTDAAEQLGIWLARVLHGYRGTIVVDDLHLTADDGRVCAFLAAAIERTADHTHWILSGRGSLELPLATWLAYGRMDAPIDEDDLRLTQAEALAVASASVPRVRAEDVAELLRITDGWPAAFAFGLHASARSSDLSHAAAGTREMMYAFLAEQVYVDFDEQTRGFLLDTCLFPLLTPNAVQAVAGTAGAQLVAGLRARAAFIERTGDEAFEYADPFRAFLEHRLRAKGDAAFRDVALRTATVLEADGDYRTALRTYALGGHAAEAVRLIEVRGFALIDAGDVDLVETTLAALPWEARRGRVRIAGVAGALAAFRERFDEAAEAFEYGRALAAGGDDAAELALRQAAACFNAMRLAEAARAFDGIGVANIGDDRLRARFASTKAAITSESPVTLGEAEALATSAVSGARRIGEAGLLAIVLQHAAVVALRAGRFEVTRSLASEAVSLARNEGAYSIAARAALVSALASDATGDRERCEWSLKQVRFDAERACDQASLHYALYALYEMAAERNDAATLVDIERRFADNGIERFEEHVLPAVALQTAWTGDFVTAYRTLARLRAPRPPDVACFHEAQRALYAAAAGLRAEANEHTARAGESLKAWSSGPEPVSSDVVRARLFHALTLLVLGRMGVANRALRRIEMDTERKAPFAMLLARALRAAFVYVETSAGHEDLQAALGRLHDGQYGGYAKLVEALPLVAPSTPRRFGALTPAELRILRAVARGSTSKSIARQFDRSTLTIDSHVKAIVRKIGCANRREAVELAREFGIVGSGT